jgi:hypothetical protein
MVDHQMRMIAQRNQFAPSASSGDIADGATMAASTAADTNPPHQDERARVVQEMEQVGVSKWMIDFAKRGEYNIDDLRKFIEEKKHVLETAKKDIAKRASFAQQILARNPFRSQSNFDGVGQSSGIAGQVQLPDDKNFFKSPTDQLCGFICCGRCRTFPREKAYQSLGAALHGDYPPVTVEEMSARGVVDPAVLRGIGLALTTSAESKTSTNISMTMTTSSDGSSGEGGDGNDSCKASSTEPAHRHLRRATTTIRRSIGGIVSAGSRSASTENQNSDESDLASFNGPLGTSCSTRNRATTMPPPGLEHQVA